MEQALKELVRFSAGLFLGLVIGRYWYKRVWVDSGTLEEVRRNEGETQTAKSTSRPSQRNVTPFPLTG